PIGGLALADTKLAALRTAAAPGVSVRPGDRAGRVKPDPATAEAEAATPAPPRPESRPESDAPARDTSPPPPKFTADAQDAGPAAPATGEPAPPAAAEVAARDVAPVEVIPARPDAPRLSAGEANLRTRSRPGTGTGAVPGLRPTAPRPPIELAMRPAPVLGA